MENSAFIAGIAGARRKKSSRIVSLDGKTRSHLRFRALVLIPRARYRSLSLVIARYRSRPCARGAIPLCCVRRLRLLVAIARYRPLSLAIARYRSSATNSGQ